MLHSWLVYIEESDVNINYRDYYEEGARAPPPLIFIVRVASPADANRLWRYPCGVVSLSAFAVAGHVHGTLLASHA